MTKIGKRPGLFAAVTLAATLAAGVLQTAAWAAEVSCDLTGARRAAVSVNAFAFDLYRALAKKHEGASVFFSPQNVSSAFAMLYAGAEGETEREIRDAFRYGDEVHADMLALQGILKDTSPDVATVDTANAVWVAKGFELYDSYRNLVRRYYGSNIAAVDYANDSDGAKRLINRWASEQTRGRIDELIKELSWDTKLVLTSSIYFRSEWATEFPKEQTKEEPFYREDGTETKADLMHRKVFLNYYETDLFQAVRLPYKNDAYSMLVLLPRERGKLAELEAAMSSEAFDKIFESWSTPDVLLYLPKFTLRTEYELTEALKSIGVERAFRGADEGGRGGAEFPRIGRLPPMTGLRVDQVLHKTFVEVGEKRTEAAAVTAIVEVPHIMYWRDAPSPPPPKIFRADHPFLYFILENKTNAILFMGRYMGP